MKVVILAGGFGTRISEESHLRPKPMIEIGGKPILWHIMKEYSHYGFNEFRVEFYSKDTFDFDELGKLAIDYSDGVIQAVPDASKVLCDYAAAKNKPLLGYQEDFGDAYEAFYESLYADEAK